MINKSFKTFYKEQTAKLQPVISRQGVITKLNITAWTADVQIVGNNQSVLKNVPLSSAIPINILVGDKVILDTLQENSPSSNTGGVVVAYMYGRKAQSLNRVNSGVASVPANTSAYPVAHGLGITPNLVSVSSPAAFVPGSPGSVASVYFNSADAIYIYVDNFSGGGSRPAYWAAAYISN